MYIYQQIAQELTKAIEQGTFGPGEKLPSIRHLSEQHQVSVATIQQAFAWLEQQRLVEARPKSGFYVKPQLNPVATLSHDTDLSLPLDVQVNDAASKVFQSCEQADILDFGIAFPHASFLPTNQLKKIASRLVAQAMPDMMQAHFSPGLLKLRQQIGQRLVETGCGVSAEQVVITNGCQEALSLSLRAIAKPGDTIAIESPAFVGLLQLIESLGMKALEIPTHPQHGISLEALKLAIEKWPVKAIAVTPSFSNPLGSCMPDEAREKLVQLANESNIAIIEDDLFGDLHFDQKRPVPLKAFDKKNNVLYCSSVSKSIAPGLRIGWLAPGKYLKEVEHIQSFSIVGVATLTQLVIAEFMQSGSYERHLRQLRMQYAKQIKLFSYEIMQNFPAGTQISQPNGGYILWVSLPEHIDSFKLYQQALQQGIAIIPGRLFTAQNKYQNCIRVNCALPWSDNVRQALVSLGGLLN